MPFTISILKIKILFFLKTALGIPFLNGISNTTFKIKNDICNTNFKNKDFFFKTTLSVPILGLKLVSLITYTLNHIFKLKKWFSF